MNGIESTLDSDVDDGDHHDNDDVGDRDDAFPAHDEH